MQSLILSIDHRICPVVSLSTTEVESYHLLHSLNELKLLFLFNLFICHSFRAYHRHTSRFFLTFFLGIDATIFKNFFFFSIIRTWHLRYVFSFPTSFCASMGVSIDSIIVWRYVDFWKSCRYAKYMGP